MYGEALAMRAFCYFNLVKHYGDVPYGYENNYVLDYVLTSRYDILDNVIASLNEVAPLMYKLGENHLS
nr:RagB/SusD family nutrient uptake outer membrane protein [Phocaeicola coprocola]